MINLTLFYDGWEEERHVEPHPNFERSALSVMLLEKSFGKFHVVAGHIRYFSSLGSNEVAEVFVRVLKDGKIVFSRQEVFFKTPYKHPSSWKAGMAQEWAFNYLKNNWKGFEDEYSV